MRNFGLLAGITIKDIPFYYIMYIQLIVFLLEQF